MHEQHRTLLQQGSHRKHRFHCFSVVSLFSNNSSIVAGVLVSRCLAMALLFIEPLPSSGRSFSYHVTILYSRLYVYADFQSGLIFRVSRLKTCTYFPSPPHAHDVAPSRYPDKPPEYYFVKSINYAAHRCVIVSVILLLLALRFRYSPQDPHPYKNNRNNYEI
jgi:hypothetical protein